MKNQTSNTKIERKEMINDLMESAMYNNPEATRKQLVEHFALLKTKSTQELENMVLINC